MRFLSSESLVTTTPPSIVDRFFEKCVLKHAMWPNDDDYLALAPTATFENGLLKYAESVGK